MNYNGSNVAFIDEDTQSNILVLQSFKEEINSGRINIKVFKDSKNFLKEMANKTFIANIVFINIDKYSDAGKNFLKEIRVFDPAIDIFFTSCADDELIRFQAESNGVCGFLKKPINFKAIKSIIKSFNAA